MTLCTKTLEDISAYFDGELELEEERAFQRHLSICSSCQEKVKVLAMLEEAVIRSAEVSFVPQPLHEYISSLSRRSRWSFLISPWAVRAVLVSILAVVGLTSWWWQYSGERRHEEIAQVLVADHVHYLQVHDALEISSTDPAEVAEWFRERIPFSVRIPHVPNARLLGGRLCSPLGQRAALVFYEQAGKRLSVFILPAHAIPAGEKEQMQGANRNTPHCMSTFGQYTLCVVGSEDVVHALVAEGPETEELAMSLFQ